MIVARAIPWGAWTARRDEVVLSGTDAATLAAIPWGAWTSGPMTRPQATHPTAAPIATPVLDEQDSLARSIARAQRATADAHALWLRQQDEALEQIARIHRALRA
jgi:hypothetical protein